MPADSRRVYATQRILVSKLVTAPASYVYDWCTDYRSDDWKVARPGTRPRFKVVRISPRRLIRIRLGPARDGDPRVAVDLLRFESGLKWHTDQIDEEDLQTVDYQVSPVSRSRSRIQVRIVERWMTPNHPSRAVTAERASLVWDRLVGLIEARYQQRLPAKG